MEEAVEGRMRWKEPRRMEEAGGQIRREKVDGRLRDRKTEDA